MIDNLTRYNQDMDGSMEPDDDGRWVRFEEAMAALSATQPAQAAQSEPIWSKEAEMVCDGRCDKAWGITERPHILVRQRSSTDCGVACLAMAATVDYEAAKQAFDQCGLGVARGSRPAYSSNFKELLGALRDLGLQFRLRRFSSWSVIKTPAIIKVQSGKEPGRDWHWVFANRTLEFGLYVLDPNVEFPYIERMPMDVMCVDISFHRPYGSFLELAAASEH